MKRLLLGAGLLFGFGMTAFTPLLAHEAESIKVVVAGDGGTGERAYRPGFVAVSTAMQKSGADVILHLGDFVYQPKRNPKFCPDRYIDEIRDAWVKPYAVRIFVAGDNDLPPQRKKSRDSGCWEKIAPLATRFDTPPKTGPQPGEREGYITLENTLFVVLDALDWRDPAPWLQPVITDARRRDLWIVFALHVPAVTTAWYKEKRQTVLKDINQLRPDLVLAGNQHSYERFYPMGLPRKNGALPVVKKSVYPRGTGVTHVVSGGGGAKIKPFADLQDVDKRTAPDAVLDALAKRALMFNYLTLDISHDHFKVQAYRVCPPPPAPEDAGDPRWHADDDMWKSVPLACDGKPPGVAPFDQFEITR